MEHYIIELVNWLSQFSYLGIIIALSIEFVPAEIVLPLAGFWVFEGKMNYYLVVLAGTVGGTIGPLTLYAVGRIGGRPFLLKYGKYLLINESHITKSDAFFQKHGNIVAFTGRFIPGIRTLISIPCGISKMSVWVFALYTFLAMLPITAFYVYLGTRFGSNLPYIKEYASHYLTPIGIGIFCLLGGYFILKSKKQKASL